MSFRIVSYYTLDTPYEEVANEYLLPSLTALRQGIKTDIKGVPNLKSWQANTGYKPQFIENMLEQYTEDIVFLDCDAEILQYPTLFDEITENYNFACHILDRDKWYGIEFPAADKKELLSGTLFIRNNKESRQVVREWNMTCKISPQIWEQRILGTVLQKNNIPVYELPIEYCWIKSLPNGQTPIVTCKSPIIVHNQVSRKLRNKVNVP